MRVLTVGNRYPPWSMGGYEVVWSAAVQWLRGAGHSVRVLTTRPDPSDRPLHGPPPTGVYRELGWYWRDHAFPRTGLRASAALERANAAVLARQLREFSPDVVCWWSMGGMSLSLLERVHRAGFGAVGAVGDEWMSYGPHVDGWMSRWHRSPSFAATLAARTTGVPATLDLDRGVTWLFTSQYLLDQAHLEGWKLPNAQVLAHGVDPELFSARPGRPWGWRLCYCGRLDARKGVDVAVEALARLPETATLSVSGSGDEQYRLQLERLAQRLGVGGRVRFMESDHDRMPEVYAGADAVVFPVRWREPWGLVPLEAMAVGRPVVATRAGGGPAEYLADGRNCLQFAVDDAAALAGALRRLAADAELRDRLVAAGHRTAARFSERAFHEGLERAMLSARR